MYGLNLIKLHVQSLQNDTFEIDRVLKQLRRWLIGGVQYGAVIITCMAFGVISLIEGRYRLSDNIFVGAFSGKTSAVDLLWRINRGSKSDAQTNTAAPPS